MQVDRLVGRNHLFKRSIILIKAWCYYESRILGAHHGLISTYALETLVLYIFHLFHSSLCGPLGVTTVIMLCNLFTYSQNSCVYLFLIIVFVQVLYRFLEYYSKFDWENYCISLKGPVCKSSLPDIVGKQCAPIILKLSRFHSIATFLSLCVSSIHATYSGSYMFLIIVVPFLVKVPENGWTDLMFSEEFLENCVEMFSVSSRKLEGKPKAFQPKHLNIIDPLKENNNLGRSVHIGKNNY